VKLERMTLLFSPKPISAWIRVFRCKLLKIFETALLSVIYVRQGVLVGGTDEERKKVVAAIMQPFLPRSSRTLVIWPNPPPSCPYFGQDTKHPSDIGRCLLIPSWEILQTRSTLHRLGHPNKTISGAWCPVNNDRISKRASPKQAALGGRTDCWDWKQRLIESGLWF